MAFEINKILVWLIFKLVQDFHLIHLPERPIKSLRLAELRP